MAELNLVEKVIALEGVDLLERLSPDQLSRIALIAREVWVPPDRPLLTGDRPDALYVVVEGSVELSQNGEPLESAGENAVLGVWALFDESESTPLTARTLEDTRVLRISRDDFYDLLADNSEMTSAIFSTLVGRFRKLVEQ